jgi:shikimate 5-dehydrogenase
MGILESPPLGIGLLLGLTLAPKPTAAPSGHLITQNFLFAPESVSSARGLEACRRVLGRLPATCPVEYVQISPERGNSNLLAGLPAGCLVVNATGLGKDAPGSPLADDAVFPAGGLVWEFNYRGTLEFLHQARRQQAARPLAVEDGLTYFVYGWALVIGEVFHRELSDMDLETLLRVTGEAAPAKGREAGPK